MAESETQKLRARLEYLEARLKQREEEMAKLSAGLLLVQKHLYENDSSLDSLTREGRTQISKPEVKHLEAERNELLNQILTVDVSTTDEDSLRKDIASLKQMKSQFGSVTSLKFGVLLLWVAGLWLLLQ